MKIVNTLYVGISLCQKYIGGEFSKGIKNLHRNSLKVQKLSEIYSRNIKDSELTSKKHTSQILEIISIDSFHSHPPSSLVTRN